VRKVLSVIISLLGVVAATAVLSPAPAFAAFGSTATAADAPDPDPAVGCLRHPIQYAVDVAEGTISWNLDIRVYRSGRLEDTLTPNRFSGAPATGTVYLDICATDDPEGTWTLQPVVTRWTGPDGVAHETEIPGTPSTFEVGEIIPLACPACEVSSQVTLRFARASGRWHAKLALVNRYAGEPLRIWEARLHLDKKTSHGWSRVATVLTDRYGRAAVTRGLRPGRVYQASYGGGWIQYDDDNRLSVPKARSPRVRVG
jgi:hypothetical protein